MVRSVRVENKVSDVLARHPRVRSRMGEILLSVEGDLRKGIAPWLRIDRLDAVPVVLDVLSAIAGKYVIGYVLDEDASPEDITPESIGEGLLMELWEIKKGGGYQEIVDRLTKSHWKNVKRVWSRGEYSILGESVTLWPTGYEAPLRVEFEEEKIVRLGTVSLESWRLDREFSRVYINERVGRKNSTGSRIKVKEFSGLFRRHVRGIGERTSAAIPMFFANTGILSDEVESKVAVRDIGFRTTKWSETVVRQRIEDSWDVYIVTEKEGDRVERILDELEGVHRISSNLSGGFEIPWAQIMVLTDHELWGTVQLSDGVSRGTYADLVLDSIKPGDFVVHEDHGIGVYAGIKEMEHNDSVREYVELRYAENDKLFVPLSQLKRLTKYVGVEGRGPKLTRLGGGYWRSVQKRVKKAVKELAGELLRLYAVREISEIDPLKDSDLAISEFEDQFEFVETEDQIRAITDIKEDLKKAIPMDRLLVGDVGFGKTEVAMRAAYMVAKSGKQVAVLAPTTVLVEQHYRVFSDRFSRHGIKVEALSRFLTDKEAEDVVSRINNGTVDIVIGTHRLLSGGVQFKDLGLLVIDEEQKFGVAQKEKLKKKRVDVHVLSMSATPIPRTLNMALSGVRDISFIATAPEGRMPIKNIVRKFNWDMVADAIKKEIDRGGQVYFVHNRVSTIETLAEKMSEIIPGVRIVVGHGQMKSSQLSRVMREFHKGEHDVLLCTTIIENGLDMPNVNTLIIDRAEMFGLAQLYQIRGRIGRGKVQGYAYFLYHGSLGGRFVKQAVLEKREEKEDDLSSSGMSHAGAVASDESGKEMSAVSSSVLWGAARERLDAINALESLGSGFALAQRDLEIRGAGNFLGRQQHGNISAIGFTLYCTLLDEMVGRLKNSYENGESTRIPTRIE